MLKEKVIENIRNNPEALNMEVWLNFPSPFDGEYTCETDGEYNSCGTIGCFAGHIVAACASPEFVRTYIELGQATAFKLLSPQERKDIEFWYEKEKERAKDTQFRLIPAYARYLWAQEYGSDAAHKLSFYPWEWKFDCGYQGVDFDEKYEMFSKLTAENIIKYLESL